MAAALGSGVSPDPRTPVPARDLSGGIAARVGKSPRRELRIPAGHTLSASPGMPGDGGGRCRAQGARAAAMSTCNSR